MTTPLLAAGCFLTGLVVGSFLNVVAYRVPQGRSVVRPGSACPACGTAIRPRDNLPVVSWLILRGRCRACGTRIPLRYPVVELGSGVLFAATALLVGPSWTLPAYLWFVGVTLTVVLTDLDHHLIPNRILYPGTAVGAALLLGGAALEGDAGAWLRGTAAGLGTFAVLLGLAMAARGGFGLGDVKLGFLLGLFTGYVGWGHAVLGLVLAFLLGGVVAILLLVTGRRGRKDAIPFGPYLVVGSYAAIAFGDRILSWYLG